MAIMHSVNSSVTSKPSSGGISGSPSCRLTKDGRGREGRGLCCRPVPTRHLHQVAWAPGEREGASRTKALNGWVQRSRLIVWNYRSYSPPPSNAPRRILCAPPPPPSPSCRRASPPVRYYSSSTLTRRLPACIRCVILHGASLCSSSPLESESISGDVGVPHPSPGAQRSTGGAARVNYQQTMLMPYV